MIDVKIIVNDNDIIDIPLHRYEKHLDGSRCDQKYPLMLLAKPIEALLKPYQLIIASKISKDCHSTCYELGHYMEVAQQKFILPAFCDEPPFIADDFEFLFIVESIYQQVICNTTGKLAIHCAAEDE